jgi:glyoxylase-like metal-dependent hydrolase (beta-lactamase superfamily II)
MVHLPRERLLIEADAFTPGAPNSPVPARPNEDTVNLAENIERLRLSVDRILPLHGPIVPVAELYRVIGRSL